MNEWNAIDLHIHTVSGITRDKTNDNVEFTYCLFGKAIHDHNLKLMACTNHNIIDMTNYVLMRHLAKIYDCNILLGVELDSTMSMGKAIHIATIFEENFIKNFQACNSINLLTSQKNINDDNIIYNDDEIIDILKNYNCLLIPHGDKDRGVFKDAGPEQIKEALKKIREGFIRVFDSSSNWKFERIKKYLFEDLKEENLDEFGGVLFSDNRNWNNYDDKFKDFYMNAEPTFKGLIHSISNPTKRFSIGKEIIKNNNYIKKIVIKKKNTNARIEPCTLELSSGYNCIIGKSGSGKSLLLYLINKYLKETDTSSNSYSFSDNSEVEFYNEDGKLLDSNTINISFGENIYDRIISAVSSKDNSDYYKVARFLNPDFISKEKFNLFKSSFEDNVKKYCGLVEDYNINLDILKAKINNFNGFVKKKNELEKVNIFNLENIENSSETTYSDTTVKQFDLYSDSIKKLEEIAMLYKGKKKEELEINIKQVKNLFNYASKDIANVICKERLIKTKYKIINDSISSINGARSSLAREKSQIINRDLPTVKREIVSNVLSTFLLKKKINNYDLSVKKDDYNSIKTLSSSENVVVKELLDDKIFTEINEKDNYVFKTHGKKQLLIDKNYNFTNKEEARNLINKYITLGVISKDNANISDQFDVNVSIYFDDQNVEELNPGDIAKKYVEIYFSEQVNGGKFNVVLFDQIENDVDKEFINIVIRDLIEKTKGKVQLIVVTHDPIVAVNADPNNYIQSTKDDNIIKYRNFVAESSLADELDTIARIVDGSRNVIKGRYEIYEGEKIYGN